MEKLILCATVVGAAFAAVLTLYATNYSLHQDLAGGVLSGRLALEMGARFDLYSAYFPPIERFWYIIAAAWGGWTGVGLVNAIIVQTLFAVLISALLGFVIRQRTLGAGTAFFIVPFLLLLVLPILYKNIFGLREHLVILGLWPYLVLRAAGNKAINVGRGLRVLLGFWMGFTLLFKYLYSIVVFLIEVADTVEHRRFLTLFRIETLVSAGVVFIYLLVWLGFNPAQLEALSLMRGAIGANLTDPAAALKAGFNVTGTGFVIWLLLFRFKIAQQQRLLGLAAVVGVVIVAWLQERWYTHHLFPVTMAFMAWWWMVGAALPKWLHILPAIVLAVPFQHQFAKTRDYQVRVLEVVDALEAAGISLTDKRVGLLAQHPSPFNQVIAAQDGLRWTPLMNVPYVSTELKPFDTPQNRGQIPPAVALDAPGARLLHGQLMSLWRDEPPDVLILDTSYQWPLHFLQFSWEQVLSEDPEFQEVFAAYEPVLTHDAALVTFTYYVRSN